MIGFNKIRIKNYKNIGGMWVELDFDSQGFYRIQGKNGTGKCVHYDTKINIKVSDDIKNLFIKESNEKS